MKTWFWIALLAAVSSSTYAESQPAAGSVILSIGQNTAQLPEQPLRPLTRLDSIFHADELNTSAEGRLQIRFSDGSRLALEPDSHFKVALYEFDSQQPEAGKAVYRLLKGGMRTLSGQIGKVNKSNYAVETAVATIGIRGTDYRLQLQDEVLNGQVYSGAIQVQSATDSKTVPAGSSFEVSTTDTVIRVFKSPAELSFPNQDDSTTELANEDGNAAPESQSNGGGSTSQPTGSLTAGVDATLESLSNTVDDTLDATLDATTDALAGSVDSLNDTLDGLNETVGGLTGGLLGANDDPSSGDISGAEGAPNVTGEGSAAPSNSLVAVAFREQGLLSQQVTAAGITQETGTTITVDDSAGTGDLVTGFNTNNTGLGNCSPCVFSGPADTSKSADISNQTVNGSLVTWGRWNSDFALLENGSEVPITHDFHFIYTDDLTTASQLTAVAGAKSGQYLYTFNGKGTAPQIETGATGSLVNYSSSGAPAGRLYNGTYVLVDWDSQTINQLSIMADVNDGSGTRQYRLIEGESNKALSQVLDGKGMNITGTCSGGKCTQLTLDTNLTGRATLDLVGDSADAAISSFAAKGSNVLGGNVSVTGTALLEDGGAAP